MSERPGFGSRHPELAALLAARTPAGTAETAWLNGKLPLRVSAYLTPDEPPADVVGSVRCLVRVGDRMILCENVDGAHPWPGGRRESGESYVDTAVREVYEETGWSLQPESLVRLGWLHFEHLAPRRPNDPYPYPDIVQVVYRGTANERAVEPDAEWADTDGYESARLVTVAEACALSHPDMLAHLFLDRL